MANSASISSNTSIENPTLPSNGAASRLDWPLQRAEFWLAVLLTVGLSILHIVRPLRLGALWRDEVSTVGASLQPSLRQIWSVLPYESSFPIAPYLMVHFWAAIPSLGSSDASFRALGCLIGLGTLAALWISGRSLGYRAPVFSLVFFALNPTVVQWIDMLRGYGVGTLLIVVTYGAVWRVVRLPSKGNLAFATATAILSVQSMYQNSFLLLAIGLGAFLCCVLRGVWKRGMLVLGIGAVAALTVVPYYAPIRAAREALLIHWVSMPYWDLLRLFALVLGSGNRQLLTLWLVVLLGSTAAAVFFLVRYWKAPNYASRVDLVLYGLTTGLAGAELFLVFLKSSAFQPSQWYFIVLLGFLGLSLDTILQNAFAGVTWRSGILGCSAMLVAFTLPALPRWTTPKYTNIDAVASRLNELTTKGDLVVISPFYFGITFQRYYRGAAEWTTIPPIEDLSLTRLDLMKDQMAKENPLQPVFDRIESTLHSGHAVWVVGSIGFPPPGTESQVVPPAPRGPHGWWAADYYLSWAVQLGSFLRGHATEVRQVTVPTDPRVYGIFENPSVLRYRGFRPVG